MNDAILLQALTTARDRDAFTQLVQRYVGLVYSAAYRQLGPAGPVEDVTQAVFLLLWQRPHTVRPPSALPGWLVNTARLASLAARRAEARRRKREQKAAAMKPQTSSPSDPSAADVGPWLDAAMAHLSPLDRSAIVLRYLEDQPLAQVAAALGISEAAAAKRVTRALGKLRGYLARSGPALASPVLLGDLLRQSSVTPPPALAQLVVSTVTVQTVPAAIAVLAQGALHMMNLAKLKVATLLAAVVILLAATGTLIHQATGAPPVPPTRSSATAPEIQELRLGPVAADIKDPVFSADGRHVAYVIAKGGKECVVVDQQEGSGYDEVPPNYVTFSPNGQRVAYRARKDTKWVMVVDGRESPEFDSWPDSFHPLFSLDGSRVAYPAQRGTKAVMMVDGQAGPEYDKAMYARFSPDGRHLAYVVKKANKKQAMVFDGQEGPEYAVVGLPVFSPDSKHLAYDIFNDDKNLMVVDGKVTAEFNDLPDHNQIFNSGATRARYTQDPAKGMALEIDGKPSRGYRGMGMPVFSADGKRVAYYAMTISGRNVLQWRMVIDGQQGPAYDQIGENPEHRGTPPIFSPDGQHLAYAASKGGQWFIVRDGREGPAFDSVAGLIYSPDGQHLAYQARKGAKWMAVMDEKVDAEFDQITNLAFSPDSQHWAYQAYTAGKGQTVGNEAADPYLGRKGGKSRIVVDGQADGEFEYVGGPVFGGSGELEYLAIKENALYRIRHGAGE